MRQPDDHFIERVRDSDAEAFRLLFQKYQPILFRSVLYNVEDVDAAHDIVQETFVRVWRQRTSLKPNLSFVAYLFRISRNLIVDQARHRAVRARLEVSIPHNSPSAGECPDEALAVSMLEERLADLIRRRLPPKCREIFVLSRMEGLSNAEVAAQLGLSVKTVENQITRALKILRKHLNSLTERT